MNSDFAFTIGNSHDICQDYSLSYSSDKEAIIVCDGCSSSNMVDVGARLLALATLSNIKAEREANELLGFIGKDLVHLRNFNDIIIDETMLDATLLTAYTSENNIYVVSRGDGVIVKYRNDDTIDIIDIHYPSGYPYYLSYELFPDRKNTFQKVDQGVVLKNYTITPEGEKISEGQSCSEKSSNQLFIFDKRNYKSISLLSDGVHSFSRNRQSISFLDIIKELVNFKTTTGRFVQRRFNKFKKYCLKENYEHYDDLSMATINFENDVEI